MDQISDMAKNATTLKRVNTIYRLASKLYVGIGIPYTIYLTVAGIISSNPLVILEILLKIGLISCGVLSCYTRKKYFVFLAFAFQLLSACINTVGYTFLDMFIGQMKTELGSNEIFFILVIVACVFTLYADYKYSYLETQEGFPYFNERYLKQEKEIQQNNIKDKYQENYECIIKSSSDEMQDISNSDDSFSSSDYNSSTYDNNDYMDSV